MTRRIRRGLSRARQIAEAKQGNGDRGKYPFGAVLCQGNRIISIGSNNYKTHPDSQSIFRWQHAEFNCLVGLSPEHSIGGILFVVRLGRKGDLKISKPCEHCMELIKKYKLKQVWYINRAGQPESMKVA